MCMCPGQRERSTAARKEREREDGNGELGDMGWRIEVAAGLGFFAVGLIQAFKHMTKMRARKSGFVSHRNRQKSRFHDLDLYTILVLCIVHILFDMALIHHEERKSHGFAAAVNVERLGVVSVFLLYSVVALIVENYRVLLPVPSEVVKLLAMFAFGQEFLLFYFQVDNAGLEVQYYHLLLVPIGVCLVTTGAEIPYPNSDLLPLLRSMALVLQGTWFFQIAASLFTKWISQGCLLSETGEGDYTVSCQGMHLTRGQAIATLQFNCHLAFLLLFLLPLYSIMSTCNSSPQTYEPLGDAEGFGEAKELVQVRDPSRISPHFLHADNFHVIQEDEELEEVTP